MYLVAIAWMYVVLMMAVVEALSSQGTVLGALFTLVLYGVLPCGLAMYLLGTPLRRKARLAQAAGEERASPSSQPQPDGGSHAPGGPIAPK